MESFKNANDTFLKETNIKEPKKLTVGGWRMEGKQSAYLLRKKAKSLT